MRLLQGDDLVAGWHHLNGGMEKCFCRTCGAHLFSRDPDDPTKMAVRMSASIATPACARAGGCSSPTRRPGSRSPDDGLARYDGRTNG
jgi:hypothetical protein